MRLAPIAAFFLLAAATAAHAQEVSPADDAAAQSQASTLATPTTVTTLSPGARVQTTPYGPQVVLGAGAGYGSGVVAMPTAGGSLQQSTAQIGAAKAQYDAQQAQSKMTFDPFRTPAFQPAKSTAAAAKDAADEAKAAAALAASSTTGGQSAQQEALPLRTGQEGMDFNRASRGFAGVSNDTLTAWGWDDPRMLLARRQLSVVGVPDRVIFFEAGRQSPIEFSDWVARRVAVVADPSAR